MGKSRRICITSTRRASELLFRHEFILTNFSKDVSTEMVFQTYSKRGTKDNYIKEAKNCFYFDKTDSPGFIENHTNILFYQKKQMGIRFLLSNIVLSTFQSSYFILTQKSVFQDNDCKQQAIVPV